MKIKAVFITIAATLMIPGLITAEDTVVIGNPSVAVSALKRQEVKYIFLGKKTKWDDGSKIIFVTRKDGDTHEMFLEDYIRKSPFQYSNYWRKQVFTGKGSSPQRLENDQAVIKFVGETSGAIGYVSAGTDLNNVKTIRVK